MKKVKKRGKHERDKKSIIFIIIFILVLIMLGIILMCNKKEDKEELNEIIETSSIEENVLEVIIEKEKKEIDSNVTDWNLILVNKENPIPEGYKANIGILERNAKLDVRIIEAAKQMIAGARSQGLKPVVCSSYRTNSYQTNLFNKKVRTYKNKGLALAEAEEAASYWVTRPGTSEHEIGLCMDIVSSNYQILDKGQENTAVQKWLMENCYNYGFILRYPTDKSEITKINYEPWHYRYVGIENAKFMKEKGFCLEEYIEYLKSFE